MQDCIFCRILRKELPSKIIFEDSETIAIRDINPQAPTHILVIPRRHIASLHDCTAGDEALLGRALTVVRDMAEREGLNASGYRVVLNTGAGAGQTVLHIHFHLIGGRAMSWPPG